MNTLYKYRYVLVLIDNLEKQRIHLDGTSVPETIYVGDTLFKRRKLVL